MSLNGGRQTGSGELLSVLVLRERGPVAGAVGMCQSRERFARAVGREGNLLLVFLAFHPTVISTAFRGVVCLSRSYALRLAIPAIIRRLASCISIAASVSDCFCAMFLRSAMLAPLRR